MFECDVCSWSACPVLALLLTVLLEDTEGLDHDLRGRADKHLALSTALGVDDVVEGCRVSLVLAVSLARMPFEESIAMSRAHPYSPSLRTETRTILKKCGKLTELG